MTGYGRAARVAKGQSMVAEIRSVNHRFLEIKLRGAGAGSALEDQVGARVRKCFERGSVVVTLSVREEPAAAAAEAAAIAGPSPAAWRAGPSVDPLSDRPRAQRVFAELSELASSLGTPQPTLTELIAALALQVSASSGASSGGAPGGLGPVDLAEQLEAAGALPELLALVDEAAAAATAMRRTEGEALAKDLAARLELLAGHTAQLQRLAAESAPVLAERLHERVRKLLAQLAPAEQAGEAAAGASGELVGGLDAGRLAQEVALLVDRADVTEELVRLASHLEQGRALLTQPGSLGRRLEFLLQEIGRELNTIGAKSWSSAISTRIVEAKSELEKLREQAQNVE